MPLQFIEIHGEAEIHLQPVEDPKPEQVDAQGKLTMYEVMLEQTPGRIYGLMERRAHSEATFLVGLLTL